MNRDELLVCSRFKKGGLTLKHLAARMKLGVMMATIIADAIGTEEIVAEAVEVVSSINIVRNANATRFQI